MCHVCVEEASQRASQGSQATEVGGVRLTARSAVAKSTTVGSAARHSAPSRGGRPRCKCRCGCQRRPGRRIECPGCYHQVGPGCCWNEELELCHLCVQQVTEQERPPIKNVALIRCEYCNEALPGEALPFVECEFCRMRPSFHHGRCCPQRPTSRPASTAGSDPRGRPSSEPEGSASSSMQVVQQQTQAIQQQLCTNHQPPPPPSIVSHHDFYTDPRPPSIQTYDQFLQQ